jgi:hypothetical protein
MRKESRKGEAQLREEVDQSQGQEKGQERCGKVRERVIRKLECLECEETESDRRRE